VYHYVLFSDCGSYIIILYYPIPRYETDEQTTTIALYANRHGVDFRARGKAMNPRNGNVQKTKPDVKLRPIVRSVR